MATRKILWYEGAMYHITLRGIRKSDIFRDESDFHVYLRILENNLIYYSSYNYRLVAYCLMDTHIHLIIKTDTEPLKRFMARLDSMYTKYFNKKYDYSGHLFEDDYFADIIKTDGQMITAARYVHLNPVKARIIKNPAHYIWSSYSMTIGQRESKLIDVNIILNYFSNLSSFNNENINNKNRIKRYKQFVEDPIGPMTIQEHKIQYMD